METVFQEVGAVDLVFADFGGLVWTGVLHSFHRLVFRPRRSSPYSRFAPISNIILSTVLWSGSTPFLFCVYQRVIGMATSDYGPALTLLQILLVAAPFWFAFFRYSRNQIGGVGWVVESSYFLVIGLSTAFFVAAIVQIIIHLSANDFPRGLMNVVWMILYAVVALAFGQSVVLLYEIYDKYENHDEFARRAGYYLFIQAFAYLVGLVGGALIYVNFESGPVG